MSIYRKYAASGVAALLATTFLASAAVAQAPAGTSQPPSSVDPDVATEPLRSDEATAPETLGNSDPDIIVTARRRDENLLQVPVAISALNAEAIEARGLDSIEDISDYTPGFHYTDENLGRNDRGFNTLTFRGMEAGTFLVTRQPAQAFLDGVPIMGANIPGLADIERVEVIKGPQSAYFGRSTFSGAINFITRDPGFEWSARIAAEAARFGTLDNSLTVEGPIVADKVAFRLTGRYYNTDGQYRNAANTTERLGARSTRSLAGTLLITPTDRLKIKTYVGVWKDRDGPAADAITGSAERNCDPTGIGQNFYVCGRVPFTLRPDQIGKVTTVDQKFLTNIVDNQANLAQVFDENFLHGAGLERHAMQITFDAGYELANGIGLDLLAGYNTNKFQIIPGNFVVSSARTLNPLFPRSGCPTFALPGCVPGVRQFAEDMMFLIDQGNRSWGGEFRITSPAAQRFRWMVGASRFFQEAQGRSRGEANAGFSDGALITDRDVWTTGVFTGLAFDFTKQLTLNVEGRYQWDYVESQVVEGPGGPGVTTGPEFSKTYKSFQPRVILEFAPTDDFNIYLSAAQAYRPGDFNANLAIFTPAERAEIELETGANAEVLAQEKLQMFEAGIKGRFFDNRLRLALAAYYGDWKNIHVFTNLTIGDTGPGTGRGVDITTSSGNAKLYGVEAEGALNLTDRFSIDYSFAYTRAELGEDYRCSSCDPLIGTRIVTGNQKARVPKYAGNLGANYAHPLTDRLDLIGRVGLIYKGNTFAEDANLASTGPAKRVNASLTLQREDFSITLFGTNIFHDKTYLSLTPSINQYDRGTPMAGFPLGPGRALRTALPEKPTYGIRVTKKF
jgi:iron complex outermembrane recepter protein